MGRGGNDRGGSAPRDGAAPHDGSALRGGSWRVLATAPWRRAPLLLRRELAVLSAVLFAGLILGAASAAVPLLESSVALAVVPQALGLVEELSVRENVALPVRLASRSGRRAPPRAGSARALVLGPRLLLADEPSAHHDSVWVHDVFSQLRAVAQAGAACLVATHDPDALAFADRILALEDGRLTEVAA